MTSDKGALDAATQGSPALTAIMIAIVDACCRRAWLVLGLAALLTFAAGAYTVRNFKINTDTKGLIAASEPWLQRERAFTALFPQMSDDTLLVVMDGKTPELADHAASVLEAKLKENGALFHDVVRLGGGPFFDKNGLLFLPPKEVEGTADQLIRAQPFLGSLSADPSLRGVMDSMSLLLGGVQAKRAKLDDFAGPIDALTDAFGVIASGQREFFSWRTLLAGQKPTTRDLRSLIELRPQRDFQALEPGKQASDALRAEARALGLTPENGVTVRLTGQVALADEEFATVADGAFVNNAATILIVLTIIWLALKSAKIVFAVFVSLIVGLSLTAAVGLLMVGALNLISIAFAVLFVGIGVDFGIQFSVRYRAERFADPDLRGALDAAAAKAGRPLALAAAATTAGFYSFLPTAYLGVSELGKIAGTGMIIAFFTSITVLPAMLLVLRPPGEEEPVGYRFLAPVDAFLARHRIAVIALPIVAAALMAPLLLKVQFDFNPLHLRSDKVESMATLLDLMKSPDNTANSINVLAPSLAAAQALEAKFRALPEVDKVLDLGVFVPQDQPEKLAIIEDARNLLGPTLSPPRVKPAPSDEEDATALARTAGALAAAADADNGKTAPQARKLGALLKAIAAGPAGPRAAARIALVPPLNGTLDQLRASLSAEPVSLETLPGELKREWVAADGRARVELTPKGDANNNDVLRAFTRAVQKIEPLAVGTPVAIQESGRTIVGAFIEAGGWALLSISILLLIVLRRPSDVLLTLVPLLLAGVLTLEITVLIDMPLNFANIIALPLLLGLGVAFKIYFVMAWRAGVTNLLQSSLTRAVFFSAMTTATAFGSLWLSKHPGTSSMGKLLALSLLTTLAAAVLFQPALMGPPRKKEGHEVT